MTTALYRDFETRSALDLPKAGARRYASDASTELLCVAYAIDDGAVEIWTPGQPIPEAFHLAARDPGWLVIAHNDHFETSIETRLLGPHFGWPLVPIERHRCTMAMTLACALPPKLENAARVLNLNCQKDIEGSRLMMRMAQPRHPYKHEDSKGIYWDDGPELRERLYQYCKQDVETERALYQSLPPLSPAEQRLWELDAGINERGFYTDGVLLEAASRIAAAAGEAIQSELVHITSGVLFSTDQVTALLTWLAEHGCEVKDLRKPTLKHALRRNGLDPIVRRVIELRLGAAHAAAAKIDALLAWRDADGRVRGTLRFHGASTGRWAGYGPQPQNMKRDGDNIDAKMAAIMTSDLAHVASRYPQPLEVVGDIARAMICAAPGHRLLIGDFSGIESRVLAWISGQQTKLDQWVRFDASGSANDDPYIVIGRSLGHSESAARAYGKIADLAFGFQGGVGAWQNFAPEDDTADEATVKRYRDKWRADHPHTEHFWKGVDRAAIKAVRQPGAELQVKKLKFRFEQPFLRIVLPSGRALSYPFPRIEINRFGHPCVMFKDNASGKWTDCNFGKGAYGGLWTENIVSGIARDLLAAAMMWLEAAGYRVVLHVHDEIVVEAPIGFGSIEQFHHLLTAVPDWAAGLPVTAKVREGERFCKISKPEVATESQPESGFDEEESAAPPANDDLAIPNHIGAPIPMSLSAAATDTLPPWSSPTIIEVPPGSAEFEEIFSSLNAEDRAVMRPTETLRANGQDQSRHQHNQHAESNGHNRYADESNGDYHDDYSAKHAGKPFTDAHLQVRGYQLARVFTYQLPDGTELYYENRYELRPGIAPSKARPRKTSRFRHTENGVEVFDTGPRRIIYNWPAIIRAGPGTVVHVTEGANKSAALNEAGLLATAVAYHQWTPECIDALAGRHLIIHADHNPDGDDDPGPRLAAEACNKLAARAASVRVVPAAHLWKHLPPDRRAIKRGDDVKDWLEVGGDPTKLLDICRAIPAEGNKNKDPLFWHGEPDPRQRKKWRIKHLMPEVRAGLLSGQWGTYKTFMAIELATTVIAAHRQFCGRQLVAPCGVLILATEGAFELRDRIDTAVYDKYPDMRQAPIAWRESCPTLLSDGAVEQLISVMREAAENCQTRFKMPLGLVIIDVLADAAGYTKAGDENDPAVGAKLMGVLHRAAEACGCFVLAVDHFGKSIEAGTRGSSAKEGSADTILACLGEREVSGAVVNTRLALRKVRGGPQGQEFPYKPRVVPVRELNEEDGSETTCVIDWEAAATTSNDDPWEKVRQTETKLAMRILRSAMMKLLITHGIEMEPEPGVAAVRMIDQELVREEFYANTVADGSQKKKQNAKRQRFNRTLARAENENLINCRDIDGVAYLWLINPSEITGKLNVAMTASPSVAQETITKDIQL